jgi:hypothetical protein
MASRCRTSRRKAAQRTSPAVTDKHSNSAPTGSLSPTYDITDLLSKIHALESEISHIKRHLSDYTKSHSLVHSLSERVDTLQPLVLLLDPSTHLDLPSLQKAAILINTLTTEIHQRIECRRQVIIYNFPDRFPVERARSIILGACGMQHTACSCTRLRKSKPSAICPLLFAFDSFTAAQHLINLLPSVLHYHPHLFKVKAAFARTRLQRELNKTSSSRDAVTFNPPETRNVDATNNTNANGHNSTDFPALNIINVADQQEPGCNQPSVIIDDENHELAPTATTPTHNILSDELEQPSLPSLTPTKPDNLIATLDPKQPNLHTQVNTYSRSSPEQSSYPSQPMSTDVHPQNVPTTNIVPTNHLPIGIASTSFNSSAAALPSTSRFRPNWHSTNHINRASLSKMARTSRRTFNRNNLTFFNPKIAFKSGKTYGATYYQTGNHQSTDRPGLIGTKLKANVPHSSLQTKVHSTSGRKLNSPINTIPPLMSVLPTLESSPMSFFYPALNTQNSPPLYNYLYPFHLRSQLLYLQQLLNPLLPIPPVLS